MSATATLSETTVASLTMINQKVAVQLRSRSLSIYTIAALILLVLKYSAYPAISWWLITGVLTFPIVFVLTIILVVCLAAVVFMGFAALFALIFRR